MLLSSNTTTATNVTESSSPEKEENDIDNISPLLKEEEDMLIKEDHDGSVDAKVSDEAIDAFFSNVPYVCVRGTSQRRISPRVVANFTSMDIPKALTRYAAAPFILLLWEEEAQRNFTKPSRSSVTNTKKGFPGAAGKKNTWNTPLPSLENCSRWPAPRHVYSAMTR